MSRTHRLLLIVALGGSLFAACGADDTSPGAGDGPTLVATSNILGDALEAVAGDHAEVVTIMPVGSDPHSFQASAKQANQMREAAALVVNGAGFEDGLLDVIDAATAGGTPTFQAISAVETITFGEGGHAHEGEEGDAGKADHAGEEDRGEHDPEAVDPHFFTDPARMAVVVNAMADFLIDNVEEVDADALRESADGYVAALKALDADVEQLLVGIPTQRRVLVTNHEVFGYFADRYGFEVVGTVIPAGTTADGASARQLAELAELMVREGVTAIFADTSSGTDLAEALAAEVGGDVEVVELFSESLGDEASEGATYLQMVRTNAERIAAALAD